MSFQEREKPGDWADQGACHGMPTIWWFPTEKKNPLPEELEARRICGGCEVRSECLAFAFRTREQYGIWGGYDYEERKALIRKRRRDAKKAGVAPVLPWRDREPLTLEQQACQEAFR